MEKRRTNLLFIFTLIFSLVLYSQNQYPKLTEIVTDQAGIFNQEELIQLRKKLKDYEEKTTTQVVVLTVENLNNEDIEAYAFNVFNQNKLGQAKKDNGVLIVFSDVDRKVRIEVGYGLEHVLTDLLCYRIIYNTMIPKFKKKEFVNGIDLATTQIIDFLDDPTKADQFIKDTEKSNVIPIIFKVIFGLFLSLFVFVFGYFGSMAVKQSFKRLVEIFKGVLTGKLGFLRSIVIIPFAVFSTFMSSIFVVFPLVFVYIFVFKILEVKILESNFDIFKFIEDFNVSNILVLLFIILFVITPILIAAYKTYIKKEKFNFSLNKTDKVYFKNNISSGSSFGSSGSSSSSGSSFSGGGGSSGGGGASGSW